MYTVVRKLWNGDTERWDALTEQQANSLFDQYNNEHNTFAVSLIEKIG